LYQFAYEFYFLLKTSNSLDLLLRYL